MKFFTELQILSFVENAMDQTTVKIQSSKTTQ